MNRLNDWKFDDLKTSMRNMSIYDLLELYKNKKLHYEMACRQYVKMMGSETGSIKLKQESYCEDLDIETIIISLEITERIVKKE